MTADGDAILEYAGERGIEEVLHFTTNFGLIGILASGKVHSRDHLNEDEYLDDVKVLNSPSRAGDAAWTGYVNLSITAINERMLEYSKKVHPEEKVWWAVLAFDPVIMTHDDVHFVTTNNIYATATRGTGPEGLAALFARSVPWGHYGSVADRSRITSDALPTEAQAEVLYPQAVDLEYLRAIYVPEEARQDEVAGWIAAFGPTSRLDVSRVTVACKPEVFRRA